MYRGGRVLEVERSSHNPEIRDPCVFGQDSEPQVAPGGAWQLLPPACVWEATVKKRHISEAFTI